VIKTFEVRWISTSGTQESTTCHINKNYTVSHLMAYIEDKISKGVSQVIINEISNMDNKTIPCFVKIPSFVQLEFAL